MNGPAEPNGRGAADLSRLMRAVTTGTAWNYAAFAVAKGTAFVATIVLARLLVPDDFGLVALGLLALRLLESLRSLGIGAAVVQRQEEPERSANVAFALSLTMGTLLAVAVYAVAPLAAAYFQDPRVTPIVRVLAVSFVLSGLRQVHESRLQKALDFRRRFIPLIAGAAGKGGVSILLAWMGAGVWSLVWGQLCGEAIQTLIYWLVGGWRPRLRFNRKIARSLLRFGVQISILEFLAMLVNNLDYVFIGRRLETDQLGFYTMAFRLPELLIVGFFRVFSQAAFPAYARLQRDVGLLAAGFSRTLRNTSLITVPMALGMMIIAPEFVPAVYGERWIPAVIPMQFLAVHSLAAWLSYDAGNVYKALGKPGIITRVTILKLFLIVPVLWIAAGYSITHVAVGHAVVSALFSLLWLWIICRTIPVRPRQLVSSLRTAALSGAIMAAGLLALKALPIASEPMPRMLMLTACGVALYGLGVWILDRDLVRQILGLRRSR